MIKRVRIGKKAATPTYVRTQFENFKGTFERLPVTKTSHWINSNGQGSPQALNPQLSTFTLNPQPQTLNPEH